MIGTQKVRIWRMRLISAVLCTLRCCGCQAEVADWSSEVQHGCPFLHQESVLLSPVKANHQQRSACHWAKCTSSSQRGQHYTRGLDSYLKLACGTPFWFFRGRREAQKGWYLQIITILFSCLSPAMTHHASFFIAASVTLCPQCCPAWKEPGLEEPRRRAKVWLLLPTRASMVPAWEERGAIHGRATYFRVTAQLWA